MADTYADDDIITSDEELGSDVDLLEGEGFSDEENPDSGPDDDSDDQEEEDGPGSDSEDGNGGSDVRPSKPAQSQRLTHDETDALLAAHAGATTSDASVLELEVRITCIMHGMCAATMHGSPCAMSPI